MSKQHLIIINNNLYKLKARERKRLELSTQTEKVSFRGNQMQRFTTEDTNTILLDIIERYRPIGPIQGIFDI